jgi:hypothetical protein
MAQTDQEIAKAIAGLKALIDQLQSGHLKLLFARAGDPEWSDGAEQMKRYYEQLLSILKDVREERARLRKARLQRRGKMRLTRNAGVKKRSRKRKV